MKKYILFSILILLFVSCNKKQFLKDGNLPIFIKIHFNECGEWGGHQEELNLYKIKENYFLDFKKYNSPCGPHSSQPVFPQKLIYSKPKIHLNKEQIKSLDFYLDNLTEKRKKTFPPSNGSNVIEISQKNKSTIIVYGEENLIDEYSSLIKNILN